VISKEPLTENLTYLSMVCSVFIKKFEETGQVVDKRSGVGPKNISKADEQYLKVMQRPDLHLALQLTIF